MPAIGLTRQQHALLTFIKGSFAERGIPPSYNEMQRHLGLRSKSGIHRMVHGLADRGAITFAAGRTRGIGLPDGSSELPPGLDPHIADALRARSQQTRIPVKTIINRALAEYLGLRSQ